MTPGTIIHVCGFGPYPTSPQWIAEGIQASIHTGSLADIANGVLDRIESSGHTVTRRAVRSLDGWLHEVHALVDVDGTTMWHRFLNPSDRWPTARLIERNRR